MSFNHWGNQKIRAVLCFSSLVSICHACALSVVRYIRIASPPCLSPRRTIINWLSYLHCFSCLAYSNNTRNTLIMKIRMKENRFTKQNGHKRRSSSHLLLSHIEYWPCNQSGSNRQKIHMYSICSHFAFCKCISLSQPRLPPSPLFCFRLLCHLPIPCEVHMQSLLSRSPTFRRLTRLPGPLIPLLYSPKRTISTSIVSKNRHILRHETLARVERILQHRFRNRSLLAEAMTHRSVMTKGKGFLSPQYETDDRDLKEVKSHNEVLECVGDRVFGLVVVQALFESAERATEGSISQHFHKLVSRDKAHHYCRYVKHHVWAWVCGVL